MSARFKMILTMSLFGTIALFVKFIDMRSAEIALFRAGIALLTIAVMKLFSGKRLSLKEVKGDLPVLLLSGTMIGLNWVLLFEAYHHTTVSVATICYYFAPVVVMIASPVLFKERVTKKQAFCFAMATVGLVMITGIGEPQTGGDGLPGIALGLGAALMYASVVLMNKRVKNVSGMDKTLIQFVGAVAVLLPYVLLTGGITITKAKAPETMALFVLGVVHTGVCFYWFFSALGKLKGQEAAILSYIDPLVSIVLSVLVLGETVTALQAAGGALVLGFTLLNELKLPKKRDNAAKKEIV